MSKYMRFIAEFEVEVTDPTAVNAYAIEWSQTDDGEVRLLETSDEDERVQHTLKRAFTDFMDESESRTGVRLIVSSVTARPVSGGKYSELTIGEARVRRDDGTYPEPD